MTGLGYIILTILLSILVVLAAYRIFKSKGVVASVLILAWMVWLFFMSGTELINDLSFPPKFPLLIFLPWIVLSVYFYLKNRYKINVLRIHPRWPVLLQSFRIFIEILLLYTFYEGLIPQSATFQGLNFDILMGITAIPMAWFVYNNLKKFKWLCYAWNILGILMILFAIFIIASSLYFPQLWGSDTSLVDPKFLELPNLLLAAFLAPLGIFIHVFSLVQLRVYFKSKENL